MDYRNYLLKVRCMFSQSINRVMLIANNNILGKDSIYDERQDNNNLRHLIPLEVL